MKAVLFRLEDDTKQTLGQLYFFNGISKVFECKTLELPWLNNQKQISCITPGIYKAVKHNSPSKGYCFHIKDVPGRSHILIHSGNYNKDTLGCVLVGKDFIDLNRDGLTDITESKKTLEKMLALLPEEFEITIV